MKRDAAGPRQCVIDGVPGYGVPELERRYVVASFSDEPNGQQLIERIHQLCVREVGERDQKLLLRRYSPDGNLLADLKAEFDLTFKARKLRD